MSRSGSSDRPSTVSTGLLHGLKLGDADSWRRLTSLYGPQVYHWCRQAGLQPQDAADVGQDVFQSLVSHIGSFRRDRAGDTFRGWLWRITSNKIRDHFRRRGGQPLAFGGSDFQQRLQAVPASASGTTGDTSKAGSSGGLYRRALELIRSEFEDRVWQAFWRSAVEGDRTADIAEDLGMTPVAVRKAKSRVLRRLREELGEALP